MAHRRVQVAVHRQPGARAQPGRHELRLQRQLAGAHRQAAEGEDQGVAGQPRQPWRHLFQPRGPPVLGPGVAGQPRQRRIDGVAQRRAVVVVGGDEQQPARMRVQLQRDVEGAGEVEAFEDAGDVRARADDGFRRRVEAAEHHRGVAEQGRVLHDEGQRIIVHGGDQVEALAGVLPAEVVGQALALRGIGMALGVHPFDMEHRSLAGTAPLAQAVEDALLPAEAGVVGQQHQHLRPRGLRGRRGRRGRRGEPARARQPQAGEPAPCAWFQHRQRAGRRRWRGRWVKAHGASCNRTGPGESISPAYDHDMALRYCLAACLRSAIRRRRSAAANLFQPGIRASESRPMSAIRRAPVRVIATRISAAIRSSRWATPRSPCAASA